MNKDRGIMIVGVGDNGGMLYRKCMESGAKILVVGDINTPKDLERIEKILEEDKDLIIKNIPHTQIDPKMLATTTLATDEQESFMLSMPPKQKKKRGYQHNYKSSKRKRK